MKYFAQVFFAGFCIVLSSCVTTANSPEAPEIVSLQKFMEQHGARVIDLKKLETGHEMLSVEINGIAGNFILDSGAGATVLHEELISKYQLNADGGNSTAQASGAGGVADITSYEISSFKLEGYSFKLDRINTLDLTSVVRSLKAATGVETDGVVGQDILTAYGGVIDIANSRLYLSSDKIESEDTSK